MPWFDSHCHVTRPGPVAPAPAPGGWDDLEADVIDGALQAGVAALVTVGTDAETSRAALAVARGHEGVWATVGLHPHEASSGVATILPVLQEQRAARAPHGKLVAVGECGLDYHYDHSPRPAQKEAFAAQVGLAHQLGLTLVVHTREAWEDTFAVLSGEGPPDRTVFHCFTGGPEEARRCLDLGAYLSFSGIVTFKSAHDVRAAAALCPLDRLLVETDAPYLAPVPHRGRRNEPALVPLVGAAVASVRGLDTPDVEEASWSNAHLAFGLRAAAGRP